MSEENIWQKFNDLLAPILDEVDADATCIEIGESVSPVPEIKIIFDGFGYNEETDEEDDESEMSFAIFFHKNSGEENFVFPEHDTYGNVIIHRPDEERCFTLWYHVNQDEWEATSSPEEESNSVLNCDDVMNILEVLNDRYYKLD
jgi:hypothetical protein